MADADQTLNPGDLCRHGPNTHPRYRVIHVHEGRVWLRDADTGADAVVDAGMCHRVVETKPERDEPHHDAKPGPFSNPPGQPAGPPEWLEKTPRP